MQKTPGGDAQIRRFAKLNGRVYYVLSLEPTVLIPTAYIWHGDWESKPGLATFLVPGEIPGAKCQVCHSIVRVQQHGLEVKIACLCA